METEKMSNFWDKMGYLTFAGLCLGQFFIGGNFIIGEVCYIVTDFIIVVRDFVLKRPASDKIKNIGLTILGIGALLFNILKK